MKGSGGDGGWRGGEGIVQVSSAPTSPLPPLSLSFLLSSPLPTSCLTLGPVLSLCPQHPRPRPAAQWHSINALWTNSY